MIAEQRWLVEQEGSGSMPGGTYVEKAEEDCGGTVRR